MDTEQSSVAGQPSLRGLAGLMLIEAVVLLVVAFWAAISAKGGLTVTVPSALSGLFLLYAAAQTYRRNFTRLQNPVLIGAVAALLGWFGWSLMDWTLAGSSVTGTTKSVMRIVALLVIPALFGITMRPVMSRSTERPR